MTVLVAEIALGDEQRIADALTRNIEAESGPLSLATTIKPELDALLSHPQLGPLVKQLTLYVEQPPGPSG